MMPTLIELKGDRSEKVHYDSPDYPIYIRGGQLSHYPNYAAPSHWHDDIELIMVLAGEMDYNVNGEIIRLQSGNGILVNARQMHFGFSDSRSECMFICILLHPMLLCPVPSYENDFILPMIQNHAIPYVFLDANTIWQKKILEQIHFMYTKKDQKTAPLDVQTAFSVIWSLLYENIPLDDNAPVLQNNDLNITKNMVGFGGASYYAETFRKWFGMSPTEFRNKD